MSTSTGAGVTIRGGSSEGFFDSAAIFFWFNVFVIPAVMKFCLYVIFFVKATMYLGRKNFARATDLVEFGLNGRKKFWQHRW